MAYLPQPEAGMDLLAYGFATKVVNGVKHKLNIPKINASTLHVRYLKQTPKGTSTPVHGYRWDIRLELWGPDGRYSSAYALLSPEEAALLCKQLENALSIMRKVRERQLRMSFEQGIPSSELLLKVVVESGSARLSMALRSHRGYEWERMLDESQVEAALGELRSAERVAVQLANDLRTAHELMTT